MSKGIEFLFRVVGAILGAAILIIVVLLLGGYLQSLIPAQTVSTIALVAGIVGAIIGFIIGPRPVKQAQLTMTSYTSEQLAGVLAGGMLGLIAGALAAIPLAFLPGPLQQIAPLAAMLSFAYLGASTLANRPNDVSQWFANMRMGSGGGSAESSNNNNQQSSSNGSGNSNGSSSTDIILLDTSVIIDGRITDISKTGFITATLSVPNFVLLELQNIADSPDPIRRKRGRRGLEVLNTLRDDSPIPLEITDQDVSEVREVDSKLVALARHVGCPIMTNDYNLNRVAGLQGVNVLNINDLANAVKAAHLPGEELNVKVIQEGRENGQGVGYLDDGTMVVVEDGMNHMHKTLDVVVTKVLQTSAGRMIFAKAPDDD